MSAIRNLSESKFNQEVSNLLEKVTYREAIHDNDKEQIYRLRYRAYLYGGALPSGAPPLFKDSFDDNGSGKTFGLYIDGRLASSIRLHAATPAAPTCPSLSVFSDLLRPMFESGATVVDATRFVIDANFARDYRRLPYATARLAWMACEHVQAEILLATAGAEHQSFYKGLFGHRVVCAPRPYPTLDKPVSLMALDFQEARERVLLRHPFLRSTEAERRVIFGSAGGLRTSSPRFREASSLAFQSEPDLRGGRTFNPIQFSAVA